jgi:hypothetical protein
LAAGCALAWRLIGSSVDENGLLHEPFALVPLGWLFFFLALLSGVVHLWRAVARRAND